MRNLTRLCRVFVHSMLSTRRGRVAVVLVGLASTAGAFGLVSAFEDAMGTKPEMAAMLPQGALLSIESQDFAGLLKRWNESPEKTAWVKSDNYSVFSNSRLFGRLGGAQEEFAQAAGVPPDGGFLNEVAGKESIFAWYDIGNLEFLYITHMSPEAAEKTRLLQMRSKFSTRQIGKQTFYVRTHGDPEKGEQQRTVAFATSGDWLLLATREDLMAGALTLLAAPSSAAESLAGEPWFADAHAAAKAPGDLRMTLNLEKIVPTPYFRSYWVQRNITEMKQYRSAVADLYLQADTFREERVLVAKSAAENAAAAPDLAQLTALLPDRAGVFRAEAAPGVDAAVAGLNEKLLERGTGSYSDARNAPNADLSVQEVGTASDLETRIDATLLKHPAKGAELDGLRRVLAAADLRGMMTVSRTGEAGDGIWVPFHAAAVLSSARGWDVAAMQAAVQEALGARLTSGGLGLQWRQVKAKGGTYYEISDARPLELAVKGKLCILTDDPGMMLEMLARGSKGDGDGGGYPAQSTLVAGVDLAQERAPFARWSGLVDRVSAKSAGPAGGAQTDESPGEPAFFSRNIRSLGDAFSALERERLVEQRDGKLTRQTVTYTWRR